MENRPSRHYRLSHAGLIEHAKTLRGNLVEFLSEFSVFDSTIDSTTVSTIDALILKDESILSDTVISDRLVQHTDIVNSVMKECRSHYQIFLHFVRKAFPNSASKRNELGESKYKTVRTSQKNMILFLQEIHTIAVTYQTELLAAGCQQDYIDRLSVLCTELNAANLNQEQYKGKRPLFTDERVANLNELWDVLLLISNTARKLYATDISKMKLFLLPNPTVSHQDDSQYIEAGITLATIEEGIDEQTYLKIENTGTVNLFFYVSALEAEDLPDNALKVIPGSSEIIGANEINNGTYGQLFVQNSASEEGTFMISIME